MLSDARTIEQCIAASSLRQYAGQDILEMLPGAGIFAQSLIEQIRPARYIALEPRAPFADELQTLSKQVQSRFDCSLTHVRADGYYWDTYADLESSGLLSSDRHSHPRHEVNPRLAFIASLPTNTMDQLVAQWLSTLSTQSWLQKYGRVRLYLFVSQAIRERFLAPPGSKARVKSTFLREATCDARVVLHNPWSRDEKSTRAPWREDYRDVPLSASQNGGLQPIVITPSSFTPEAGLSLIELTPFERPLVEAPFDTFDFIIRALLVSRTVPLHRQVRNVAPGAYAILRDLPDELCLRAPEDMTVADMDAIACAFEKWPFRPRFLHSGTTEGSADRKTSTSELMAWVRAHLDRQARARQQASAVESKSGM